MISPRSTLRRLRLRLLPVPGQALGLAVLVAVLAAALVSAPLMVASAEQAAWDQQAARLAPEEVGAVVRASTFRGDGSSPVERLRRIGDLDAAVVRTAAASRLRAPELFTESSITSAVTPSGPEPAFLVQRAGAEENLRLVEGRRTADGVLIPEALARTSGVHAGGVLTLRVSSHPDVRLPVGGVYRVPTEPIPAYWTAHSNLFLPRILPGAPDPSPPPPVIVAPRAVALATYPALDDDVVLEWFLPSRPAMTVDDARTKAEGIAEFQLRLTDPEGPVQKLVSGLGFSDLLVRTRLPAALTAVDATVALLSPPVQAVGIGGGAAALVLVGAWTALRMRRREDEMRSLVARGLSPVRGAVDAIGESLLPLVLGLVMGGVVGRALVRALGPSPILSPGATAGAALLLAGGGLAVLGVVGALTAVQVTRLDQVGRGQATALLGRVPWLAVTAAVAVVTAVPVVTGTPARAGGGIGVLALVLPLLVTIVAAGVVTGLLPRAGRVAGDRLRRLPPAGFLAVRRVLAGQGATRLVIVTTALALALAVFAGALGDSTDRTIAAKASVATGSDVVVPHARGSKDPGGLRPGAMVVGTAQDAALVPGRTRVDVLVVHPDQVAGVVRWNDGFADRSLPDLMHALSGYRGDRIPVIVAGGLPAAVVGATDAKPAIDLTYYTLPIEIVGSVEAFPGQRGRDPLLIADWNRYSAALQATSRDADAVLPREVWARGDVHAVLDSLPAAGYEVSESEPVRLASDFAARPELAAQQWTLTYLRAIALAAALLGLVGVAMYALSQHRRRVVGALLLTRMGMSRRSADAATALELGLLTGLAAVVAVAVALPSSMLILRLLDPVPALSPDPLFAGPWGTLVAVAVGVLLVTGGGAVLVGRSSRRATGGEVMRDAT